MRSSRTLVYHLSALHGALAQPSCGIMTKVIARMNSGILPYTLGTSLLANLAAADTTPRLSILGNFMSLAWFLTAHILEYTSVNDCRYTSPHLWWTTFGILCILYLMVLEIFLIGLLVFVFGPVLYVSLTISEDYTRSDPVLRSSSGISSSSASAVTRCKIRIRSNPRSGSFRSTQSTKSLSCSTSRLQTLRTLPPPRPPNPHLPRTTTRRRGIL